MPIALWELDSRRLGAMYDELSSRGVSDFRAWFAEQPQRFEQARALLSVTEANDQALELFGAPDHDTLLPLMPALWSNPADFAEAAVARQAGARSYTSEASIQTVDGRERDVVFGIAFADPRDPESASLVGAIDISERKRATAALAQSELKYRNLFHHMPIGLCQLDVSELVGVLGRLRSEGVTDLDVYIDAHPDFVGQMMQVMRVEQVNEHLVALFGRGDPAEFVGPIDRFWRDSEETVRRSLCARFAGAEAHAEETRIRALDGRVIECFFTSAFPQALSDMGIGLVGFIDIRDRLEAERMLQQVQADFAHAARVATLGELSASIAHEINQPLAAIATNGEASLRWLDRPEPNVGEARELAARMVADARRAADVIRHIRAMATRQSAGRELLSVNDVVSETLDFLQRNLQARDVQVEFDADAGLPLIEADRTQLQQVMVNLAINAEQAMVQHKVPDRRLAIRTGLANGGCVCVEVEDSGRASRRSSRGGCSTASSRRNRTGSASGLRSADRSSRRMAAGSMSRMAKVARASPLPCRSRPPRSRPSWPEAALLCG
jgi:signal transduction histidine kinase